MLISVLMSVYEAEKPQYLDRALQSVWSDQSMKPDEIILVEDGPLGYELYKVIDKWRNIVGDAFVVIKNEINLGLTKSLNKGIAVAKGKYIARMDSDDISLPHRFEHQVRFLEREKNISVVGGNIQEFSALNDNLGIRHYPRNNDEVLRYIYKASPLAHPTVMMRREIFDYGILYDEAYKTSQDIALWFDIIATGKKIANLDELTLKFRRDNEVYKRRGRSKARNELWIYLKGIRRLYGLLNPYYIYPLSRYIFRLMPVPVLNYVYNSRLRKILLK